MLQRFEVGPDGRPAAAGEARKEGCAEFKKMIIPLAVKLQDG